MRKFTKEEFCNSDAGDIIAFDRTNKMGDTVTHLAVIYNVDIEADGDDEYVNGIDVLLMAPSDASMDIKKKSLQTKKPETLQRTGLETPHSVYAIGVKLDAERFTDDTIRKLGSFGSNTTKKLQEFAEAESKKTPRAFGLKPSGLKGFKFHKITAEIAQAVEPHQTQEPIKPVLPEKPHPNDNHRGNYAPPPHTVRPYTLAKKFYKIEEEEIVLDDSVYKKFAGHGNEPYDENQEQPTLGNENPWADFDFK